MKEPELENVLRQFMGDNLMEPLKGPRLDTTTAETPDFGCQTEIVSEKVYAVIRPVLEITSLNHL